MTRADKAVVIVALLAVGFSYYLGWQPGAPGARVDIYQGDTLYERLSLSRSQTVHVPGELGESVIRIDEGRARFQASSCRSKFCVHSGWVQQAGGVVACLPNGVHLQIHGGPQSRFDALAF